MSGVDTRSLIQDLPHIIDGKEVECKLAVPKDPPKDEKKRKKKKKKQICSPDFGIMGSPSLLPVLPSSMRINAEVFQMSFKPQEINMELGIPDIT
jgi:hypothetical protein